LYPKEDPKTLLGFPMQHMVATAAAIFVEFKAVRVVALILGSSVIALLAGSASEINYDAILLRSHTSRLFLYNRPG
jgi:hypothetical protein